MKNLEEKIWDVEIDQESFLASTLYDIGAGNYELSPGVWEIRIIKKQDIQDTEEGDLQ